MDGKVGDADLVDDKSAEEDHGNDEVGDADPASETLVRIVSMVIMQPNSLMVTFGWFLAISPFTPFYFRLPIRLYC